MSSGVIKQAAIKIKTSNVTTSASAFQESRHDEAIEVAISMLKTSWSSFLSESLHSVNVSNHFFKRASC